MYWERGLAGTREQKERGAFFTPTAIARYLSNWAITQNSDRILEPSCGESAFLLAAGERLQALGANPTDLVDCLHGIELHASSALEARRLLANNGIAATIETADFFAFKTTRKFDVIVGNPPFVRYQDFSGIARARSLEASLAQGVRLSGLSSSWAAFVVCAAQHLTKDGRMGLVLPAELFERRLCRGGSLVSPSALRSIETCRL